MSPTKYAKEVLGVSENAYLLWTQGKSKPRPDSLVKVARAVGVDEDWVLKLAGYSRPKAGAISDAIASPSDGLTDQTESQPATTPPVSFPQEEWEALTPEQQKEVRNFILFQRRQRAGQDDS